MNGPDSSARYLPDCPPHPDENKLAIEAAYRRGFYQGATAAVEGVDAGKTPTKLRAWLRRLYRWRYSRHGGRVEFPEWIAR